MRDKTMWVIVVVMALSCASYALLRFSMCEAAPQASTLRTLVLEQREVIKDLTLQGQSLTQRISELEYLHGTYADDDYEVSALPLDAERTKRTKRVNNAREETQGIAPEDFKPDVFKYDEDLAE